MRAARHVLVPQRHVVVADAPRATGHRAHDRVADGGVREADDVQHRRYERHGRAVVLGDPARDARAARRRRVGQPLERVLAEALDELACLG